MGPLVAGALISGGASLLGNLFGFGSQERANKQNMELAKYQWDRNLELWNLQNEYNTPLAQRQRLEDAGLNPALMYGSGSVVNTADAAPQYDAPHIQAYTNFGDFGASQALMTAAQIQNLEAQSNKANQESAYQFRLTQLLDQQEALNQLEILNRTINNESLSIDVRIKAATEQAQILEKMIRPDLMQSELDKNIASTGNITADTAQKEATTETINALRPLQVSNEEKKGKLLDAQSSKELAQAFAANAAGQASLAQKAQMETLTPLLANKLKEECGLTHNQALKTANETEKLIEELSQLKVRGKLNDAEVAYKVKSYLQGVDPNAHGQVVDLLKTFGFVTDNILTNPVGYFNNIFK